MADEESRVDGTAVRVLSLLVEDFYKSALRHWIITGALSVLLYYIRARTCKEVEVVGIDGVLERNRYHLGYQGYGEVTRDLAAIGGTPAAWKVALAPVAGLRRVNVILRTYIFERILIIVYLGTFVGNFALLVGNIETKPRKMCMIFFCYHCHFQEKPSYNISRKRKFLP